MKNRKNQSRNVEAIDRSIEWKYVLLTIVCAVLLAAGFFFAALQHFATMELGFKNSELRKQVEELEAEKRRLQLAREIALSPVELTKTAKRLGFTHFTAEIEEIDLASLRREEEVRPSREMTLEPGRTQTQPERIANEREVGIEKRPRVTTPASSSPAEKPARQSEVSTTASSTRTNQQRPAEKPVRTVIAEPAKPADAGLSRPRRVESSNDKPAQTVTAVAKL